MIQRYTRCKKGRNFDIFENQRWVGGSVRMPAICTPHSVWVLAEWFPQFCTFHEPARLQSRQPVLSRNRTSGGHSAYRGSPHCVFDQPPFLTCSCFTSSRHACSNRWRDENVLLHPVPSGKKSSWWRKTLLHGCPIRLPFIADSALVMN